MARGLLVVVLARLGRDVPDRRSRTVKDAALLKLCPVAPESLKATSAFGSTAPQVGPIEVINDGGGVLEWRALIKHASTWVTLNTDTGTAGRRQG